MFLLLGFKSPRETKKVRGPILPANIVIISIILLLKESSEVIPVDNPTVAKAETDSNSTSIKEKGSIVDNIKVVITTKSPEREIIATA